MNKKVLIYCCGLGIIACVTGVAYATCSPPVARFSGPSSIYCGDEVTFRSSSYDPDGCSIRESWSASGEAWPEAGVGRRFTTKWCSPGEKSVTLRVTDDDRPCCCGTAPDCYDKTRSRTRSVYVQPVDVVSVNSEDAVCISCDIEFTVTTSPSGKYGCIEWSGGDSPTGGSGYSYTTKWNEAGMKTVTAEGCNNSVQKQVAVVEVDSISSDDTVCVGCDITFTAITNPPGYGNLVTWSAPGGSPATGTGPSFTTKWNTAGMKTVTATCGYSSINKYVPVMEVSHMKVYPNDYYGWCTIYGGSTITVLKGAKYTFKAIPSPSGSWPAGEPQWSGLASGTGETIDVSFTSSGTHTLTAKCGSADTGKTVTIKVMVPQPDEVYFVDYSPGEEHDIYNVVDPVWKRVNNPDDPASYTKNKHIRIRAKFWAPDTLTYSTQVHVDVSDVEWGLFTEDTSETFWGWPSESTFHNSNGLLSDIIGSTTLNLTWGYKVPSGTNQWITMASNSGPHKVYAVFGAPECGFSNYTKSNVDEAVGKASGESTESSIASKANDTVGDDVYSGCICGDGFQKNFDAAMDRYPLSGNKGMCCCRAEGLDCVLNVLGIGPYTHDYVNEHPEPNPQNVYYHDCPICGVRVWRKYWDSFWNNWEGVVKAGGSGSTCYAPANGAISIDEGTYSEINSKIAIDCGYYWQKGPLFTDICTHYGPP